MSTATTVDSEAKTWCNQFHETQFKHCHAIREQYGVVRKCQTKHTVDTLNPQPA